VVPLQLLINWILWFDEAQVGEFWLSHVLSHLLYSKAYAQTGCGALMNPSWVCDCRIAAAAALLPFCCGKSLLH
jgi:hypothetical protein